MVAKRGADAVGGLMLEAADDLAVAGDKDANGYAAYTAALKAVGAPAENIDVFHEDPRAAFERAFAIVRRNAWMPPAEVARVRTVMASQQADSSATAA